MIIIIIIIIIALVTCLLFIGRETTSRDMMDTQIFMFMTASSSTGAVAEYRRYAKSLNSVIFTVFSRFQ